MSENKNPNFIPLPLSMQKPPLVNPIAERKNAGDEGEEKGDIWQPGRRNIPYLLKRFAASPIDIRDIIIMMNETTPRGRVWPKVSWLTGIPQWMLYEMIDAQYPDMPHIRQIKYPSHESAIKRPPPPKQENSFHILRKHSSFSAQDLHRLNHAIREYFKSDEDELKDISQVDSTNNPVVNPKSAKEDNRGELRNSFNEYDITELLSHSISQRGARAKLIFDRVSPVIYCIIYANLLLAKAGKQTFSMEDDSEKDIQLLMNQKFREYAAINQPRVAHWKNPRKQLDINDQMLCRLLRISPHTLTRWDHGYRAPRNIRIFFELFCQFPNEMLDMLLRVQNEIRDSLLTKLKTTFPNILIRYPSSQSEIEPMSPAEALNEMQGTFASPSRESAPQRKPRRYRGRICGPSRGTPDSSGAYHLVQPEIMSVSGVNIDEFSKSSGNLIDLAHLMRKYPGLTREEMHDMERVSKLKLPHLVQRKVQP